MAHPLVCLLCYYLSLNRIVVPVLGILVGYVLSSFCEFRIGLGNLGGLCGLVPLARDADAVRILTLGGDTDIIEVAFVDALLVFLDFSSQDE